MFSTDGSTHTKTDFLLSVDELCNRFGVIKLVTPSKGGNETILRSRFVHLLTSSGPVFISSSISNPYNLYSLKTVLIVRTRSFERLHFILSQPTTLLLGFSRSSEALPLVKSKL